MSKSSEVRDLDKLGEQEGYVLEASHFTADYDTSGLKTGVDGKMLLIPQPSNDPNDPLNWSQRRKNLVLFVMVAIAFLLDYGSATGAVPLVPQSVIWNMNFNAVNHSQAGNVFMLGVGGIFVPIASAYIGHLPTFFWFGLSAFWTAALCAGASDFNHLWRREF